MIRKKLMWMILGMIFLFASFVSSANYNVDSFSCSPEESELGSTFSCEAGLIDAEMGSTAFSGTARLVPNAGWTEESEYEKTVSSSWSIDWSGLRSTSAGEKGFYRVYLGDEEDTYVADSAYTVNIISLSLSLAITSSSVVSGRVVNITPTITAGGKLSGVSVTIAGGAGCSVSGGATQSVGDMNDGAVVSKQPWAVTIGSEDCSYTVTVTGNGDRDVASTSDSSSGVIDCSDCVTSTTSSSGGGGGGSSGGATYAAGVLLNEVSYDLALGESVNFSIDDESHILKITNMSDIGVVLSISSEAQVLELDVGEEKSVNLDNDAADDLLVKLGSINTITKKARITIRPVIISYSPEKEGGEEDEGAGESEGEKGKVGEGIGQAISNLLEKKSARTVFWILIGLLMLLVFVLIVAGALGKKKSEGEKKKRYYEF